jgi:hypothetical protein|tara:strand:+ start:211 stop:738 length:528 start_codon:yes stop_codon:yes gene_type:complete
MKRTLLVLGITLLAAPAQADITHRLTQSAQISIDQAYSSAQRIGSTYSASGTNVTPSVTSGGTTTSGAIGGLNLGSLTSGVPAMVDTDYAVTTAGSAFSFTESALVGDSISSATEVTTTTGNVDDLPTYGEVVTGSGGVKSNLAATALSSGIMTVTAGGAGTSAILSNKMELQID